MPELRVHMYSLSDTSHRYLVPIGGSPESLERSPKHDIKLLTHKNYICKPISEGDGLTPVILRRKKWKHFYFIQYYFYVD